MFQEREGGPSLEEMGIKPNNEEESASSIAHPEYPEGTSSFDKELSKNAQKFVEQGKKERIDNNNDQGLIEKIRNWIKNVA